MEIKMYSVFDLKTSVFQPPFYSHNKGSAMREIQDVLRQDNKFSRYPADFILYELGVFNDSDGLIHQDKPELISNLQDLVKKE